MEARSAWIFQYTAESRTDRLLRDGTDAQVNWLWNGRRRLPAVGDIVFFLRSGARGKDYPRSRPWRGLTGFGEVLGPPATTRGAKTDETVPVRTAAFAPDAPLPDSRVWHDHRVAGTGVLFGQQGTNFAIAPGAASALAQRMAAWEAFAQPAAGLDAAFASDEPDALTELIERRGAWCGNLAARVLHAARDFGAHTPSGGQLTRTDLLVGVLAIGSRLRDGARAGAAAAVLHDLTFGTDDASRLPRYLAERTEKSVESIDAVDWRTVNRVERVTPDAASVLDAAAGMAEPEPIPVEALIASLLREPGDDAEGDHALFGLSGDALADRLLEDARVPAYPRDLARLARWMDREPPAGADAAAPPPSSGSGDAAEAEPPGAESEGVAGAVPDAEGEGVEGPAPAAQGEAAAPMPPIGPRVASTINDTVNHADDLLDVCDEARAFARLIASSAFEPPLAIGVFGRWGTGKTFFMERIEDALEGLVKRQRPSAPGNGARFHGNIVRIKFNAWHYMETNIWASLVDVIFRELDAWLRQQTAGTGRGDEVEKLFDGLSTAQTQRLEAIEDLAERLSDMNAARQSLGAARADAQGHWSELAGEIVSAGAAAADDIERVAAGLGLKELATQGEKLRAIVDKAQGTLSDAELMWSSVKTSTADPVRITILAGVITVPLLLLATPAGAVVMDSMAGTLGTATAWLTGLYALVNRASDTVARMRRVHGAFEKVEAARAQARKGHLAQYETKLDEARIALEAAERAAFEAHREVRAGTSAGRVAAFIHSRASTDTYARHLGIIDTVRSDFEQLTALMATSRVQAKREIAAFEKQQADLEMRVRALLERYHDGKDVQPAEKELFAPVADALKKMLRTAGGTDDEAPAPANPLGVSIDRIVLFIDDLDRCPPEKVYHVLQAVHLFLNFPLFVVVVGVDTRWMETSLVKELGQLVDGSRGTSAQDYLEKIFQIPYWTRRMDPDSSKLFVEGVLRRIPGLDEDAGAGGGAGTEGARTGAAASRAPPHGEDVAPGETPEVEALEVEEPDVEEPDVEEPEVEEPEGEPAAADDAGVDDAPPTPVVLTDEERVVIAALAPQAGRSPRQLLRFVNVYGLIRSVSKEDGQPLLDPDADPDKALAMLVQLAIATGAPEVAGRYFAILGDGTLDCAGMLERWFEGADGGTSRGTGTGSSSPREHAAVTRALRLFFQRSGFEVTPADEGAARFAVRGATPGAADAALRRLRETAPTARRYTFAAIDATFSARSAATESDPEAAPAG